MWNFCEKKRVHWISGVTKRIDGDAEKFRQLILAEEFLNCVPEEVRVHLSERKTDVNYEMAALADEYILTHRKTKEKQYTGNRVKFKAELSPEGRPKEEKIEGPSKVAAEQWSATNVERLDT